MIIDRKGLIFFGLVLVLIMGFFALLGGISLSTDQISYIFGPAVTVATTSAPVQEVGLPLPKPSTITTERDGIRLDLERVSLHKYFIVYSVIYGDQSHTAYHLYLTDLKKRDVNPEDVGDIWLVTQSGERIEQIAEPTILAFPQDQPLGWKIGIIAKFPYEKGREHHQLHFYYQGKSFELGEINY